MKKSKVLESLKNKVFSSKKMVSIYGSGVVGDWSQISKSVAAAAHNTVNGEITSVIFTSGTDKIHNFATATSKNP